MKAVRIEFRWIHIRNGYKSSSKHEMSNGFSSLNTSNAALIVSMTKIKISLIAVVHSIFRYVAHFRLEVIQ